MKDDAFETSRAHLERCSDIPWRHSLPKLLLSEGLLLSGPLSSSSLEPTARFRQSCDQTVGALRDAALKRQCGDCVADDFVASRSVCLTTWYEAKTGRQLQLAPGTMPMRFTTGMRASLSTGCVGAQTWSHTTIVASFRWETNVAEVFAFEDGRIRNQQLNACAASRRRISWQVDFPGDVVAWRRQGVAQTLFLGWQVLACFARDRSITAIS